MTTTMHKSAHLLAMTAALGWTSSALAFDPAANCSGWSGAWYWGGATAHTAEVELQQLQPDGSWLTVEVSSDFTYLPEGGPVELGALWDATLDGTYRVVGEAHTYDHATTEPSAEELASWPSDLVYTFGPEVSQTFTCEVPEPPSYIDARTPGYWKNHPEVWAVDSLMIGDAEYDQACLLAVLDLPTRGDLRVKLLHHLIAAELNLLAGTDPAPIDGTVLDAHDYLTGLVIDCGSAELSGSKPKGAEKDLVDALKTTLDLYNNNVL